MAAVPRGGALPPYIIDQVRENVRVAEIQRAGFTDSPVVRRFRGDPIRAGLQHWLWVFVETLGVGVALILGYLLIWYLFFLAAG